MNEIYKGEIKMKYIYLKTKMLSGLLTGGILLSSVSTTFAATAKPLNIDRKAPLTNECKQVDIKIQQGLKTNFESLVTGKTITQDEANKIKAVINRSETTKRPTSEKSKTITEQKRKIYMDTNMINHINPLTELVDNETMTQDQADKIIMKQIYLCQVKRLNHLLRS